MHERNDMKQCIIKVAGARYVALFPSTCAAVADALARFPEATKISVRIAPPQLLHGWAVRAAA